MRSFGPGRELQTYDEWELGPEGVARRYRWIDRAFVDDRGAVVEVQSVGHDITEEHRAAALTTNQSHILEQIARGVRLEDTLATIASSVEEYFPRLKCSVLLDDVDIDLQAAWSTPILAPDGHRIVGRVASYGHDAEQPDEEHRWIFSLAAHLAAIAIERKAFEDRLAHESMHDRLTGLPNRLLFVDRLTLATARGQRTQARMAVLSLDLHRFKNINDSLGHSAGDELLIAVARRVAAMLRPGDTVAALRRRRVHDPVRGPP